MVRAAGQRTLRPTHIKKTNDLPHNILTSADDFMECLKKFSAAIIMATIYGHGITSRDDVFVEISEAVMKKISPLLVSTGAGFKREALQDRKEVQRMYDLFSEMVEEQIKWRTAEPLIVSDLLQNNNSGEEYELIKGTATTAYNYDHLSSSKFDAIHSGNRHNSLPAFAKFLPCISTLLREVLRYIPIAPLGVLHRLTEDDVYRSYHIPKGDFSK
ncbi:hypothetical protein BDN70DRAFT_895423 [Pholiota conissans]|uniref:Uncharacterized protein n=1 Tax=Pholiota conissans TaxID=109636 RepID=A0A9P5Z3P9_9AGAR|nr:hypothetical protein BDN70DRAFT_895423 [Pholiota conissans]